MHGLKVSLNWLSNVLRPPESVLRKSLNVAIREQQRQQQNEREESRLKISGKTP